LHACGKIFTASRNGTICVWDLETGDCIARLSDAPQCEQVVSLGLKNIFGVTRKRLSPQYTVHLLDVSVIERLVRMTAEQARLILAYFHTVQSTKLKKDTTCYWQEIARILQGKEPSTEVTSRKQQEGKQACTLQ
jgi:WD40 repeat protein